MVKLKNLDRNWKVLTEIIQVKITIFERFSPWKWFEIIFNLYRWKFYSLDSFRNPTIWNSHQNQRFKVFGHKINLEIPAIEYSVIIWSHSSARITFCLIAPWSFPNQNRTISHVNSRYRVKIDIFEKKSFENFEPKIDQNVSSIMI